MYVDGPVLKCPEPDRGEWIALVAVDADGGVRPTGYLPPETFALVADTLRGLHAKVAETGWPAADEVMAWEDFVAWVEGAELRR